MGATILTDDGELRSRAGVITVRRTGGFSGVVVEAEAALASHLGADEIVALLDDDAVTASPARSDTPRSDRFVYEIGVRGHTVTLHEDDLTPDQQRLIDLVLGT